MEGNGQSASGIEWAGVDIQSGSSCVEIFYWNDNRWEKSQVQPAEAEKDSSKLEVTELYSLEDWKSENAARQSAQTSTSRQVLSMGRQTGRSRHVVIYT